VPRKLVDELRREVDECDRLEYTYSLDLKDDAGRVHATIDKLVFIARRDWFEAREARRAAREPG
jgi:hypothetical protein